MHLCYLQIGSWGLKRIFYNLFPRVHYHSKHWPHCQNKLLCNGWKQLLHLSPLWMFSFILSTKPFCLHILSWTSPSSIPWDHSACDSYAIYVKLDINYTAIKPKRYKTNIRSKGNDRSLEPARHIQELQFLGFLKHGNISPVSPWMDIAVAGLKAESRTETLASCPSGGRSPTWVMNGASDGSREALALMWSEREPLEGRTRRPVLVFSVLGLLQQRGKSPPRISLSSLFRTLSGFYFWWFHFHSV